MKPLSGPDWGVARDEKHLVVESENPRVVFSFTRRGNAISIHFATDKDGMKGVEEKLNEFCDWAFESMAWCTMIVGFIGRRSVEKIANRCGFKFLRKVPGHDIKIYMRTRQWAS